MKPSKLRLIAVVAAALLAPVIASADDAPDAPQTHRYLGDRWNVRVFGNLSALESDVSAGKELGALIDLEELLGFDDQMTTWNFDAFYRFTRDRRHTIRISYADYSRDAYKLVQGTVPIFDVEFLGEIRRSFGNQVGTFNYQYSFTNTKRTEAGISAGLGLAGSDVVYKYNGREDRIKVDLRQTSLTLNASVVL